jgi:hypothetical protein
MWISSPLRAGWYKIWCAPKPHAGYTSSYHTTTISTYNIENEKLHSIITEPKKNWNIAPIESVPTYFVLMWKEGGRGGSVAKLIHAFAYPIACCCRLYPSSKRTWPMCDKKRDTVILKELDLRLSQRWLWWEQHFVTPCSLVAFQRRFRGPYRFHLQDWKGSHLNVSFLLVYCHAYSSSVKFLIKRPWPTIKLQDFTVQNVINNIRLLFSLRWLNKEGSDEQIMWHAYKGENTRNNLGWKIIPSMCTFTFPSLSLPFRFSD